MALKPDQVASFLFSTHMMVAQATSFHRLALDQAEAKVLADAACEVASFYDMPEIAPQSIAWANLVQAVAFVYGVRILAARNDARKARAERAQPVSADNSRGSAAPAPNAPQPPAQETAAPHTHKQFIPGLGTIDVPLHA